MGQVLMVMSESLHPAIADAAKNAITIKKLIKLLIPALILFWVGNIKLEEFILLFGLRFAALRCRCVFWEGYQPLCVGPTKFPIFYGGSRFIREDGT